MPLYGEGQSQGILVCLLHVLIFLIAWHSFRPEVWDLPKLPFCVAFLVCTEPAEKPFPQDRTDSLVQHGMLR